MDKNALQTSYYEYLLAREGDINDPNYKVNLEKAERNYNDNILKAKLNKKSISKLEKEVEKYREDEKAFTDNYRESVIHELTSSKNIEEDKYKDNVKKSVLSIISEPEKESDKVSNVTSKVTKERVEREKSMKEFEEKHPFELIYKLKMEVINEVKSMNLTPLERKRLNNIEQSLEREKDVHEKISKSPLTKKKSKEKKKDKEEEYEIAR